MLEQGLELDVLRGTPSEQRVPTLVYIKKNESRTFRYKKQSPERSIKCAIEVVNVLI